MSGSILGVSLFLEKTWEVMCGVLDRGVLVSHVVFQKCLKGNGAIRDLMHIFLKTSEKKTSLYTKHTKITTVTFNLKCVEWRGIFVCNVKVLLELIQ